MRIASLLLSCLYLASCASQKDVALADVYYHDGSNVTLNPERDVVLFIRNREYFEPVLAVVNGKFITPASYALRFEKFNKVKVWALADLGGGELFRSEPPIEIERRPSEEVFFNGVGKVARCVSDLFQAKQAPEFNFVYSNVPGLRAATVPSKDCAMGLVSGGDTSVEAGCLPILEWKTDLNRNGRDETFTSIMNQGFQIWENFGSDRKMLLFDSERRSPLIHADSKVSPDESCRDRFRERGVP